MENKDITVLIVEDEADLREAIMTALTYEGFNVLSAENGEMGLAIARTQKPNLILLDLMMPKMDGLTMLKHLRSDERGKDVKVIVMTALDDFERIAEVVEAGGDEYIVKTSITLSGIIEKVKERFKSP
jgi:DNA-binding response OmpR family regulator